MADIRKIISNQCERLLVNYDLHYENDVLFRMVADQTENEVDPVRYECSLAVLHLAMIGKLRFIQGNSGEILFEANVLN